MQIPEEKGLMVMGYERVKMRDFLVELEASLGIVSLACQKMRISRRTYYNWKKKDSWFREVSDEIRRFKKPELDDIAEHGLMKLILSGNTAAIIFYLKTRHPDYMHHVRPEDAEVVADTREQAGGVSLIETIKAINRTLEEENFKEPWEMNLDIRSKYGA